MTVQRKFSVIAAACENMGIGINGNLPWRLRNELKYFNCMTTKVTDPTKRNCVIMGRKTYLGIPETKRPLSKRLNIVLSTTATADDYPADVVLCSSLTEALVKLSSSSLGADIEDIWIVGGHNVYKEAMQSRDCERIYLTEILAKFECDTYFPAIDASFQLIANPSNIPSDIQEENGIQYRYKVYEKQQ